MKKLFFLLLLLSSSLLSAQEVASGDVSSQDYPEQVVAVVRNPSRTLPGGKVKNIITLHPHQQLVVQFDRFNPDGLIRVCGVPYYHPPQVNAGIEPDTTWTFSNSSQQGVLAFEENQQQPSEDQYAWNFEADSLGTTTLNFQGNGHYVNREGFFYPEKGCTWHLERQIIVNVVE